MTKKQYQFNEKPVYTFRISKQHLESLRQIKKILIKCIQSGG